MIEHSVVWLDLKKKPKHLTLRKAFLFPIWDETKIVEDTKRNSNFRQTEVINNDQHRFLNQIDMRQPR